MTAYTELHAPAIKAFALIGRVPAPPKTICDFFRKKNCTQQDWTV